MLRLSTTTGCSVLALLVGVAGTAWLSLPDVNLAMTPVPAVPRAMSARVVAVAPPAAAAPRPMAPPPEVNESARFAPPPIVVGALHPSATPPPLPRADILVPVSMPQESASSWARLRGHLDGRIVLHVDVDAAGKVRAARIARSSGDEVLDAEALRSVLRWRFAVPVDAPDGLAGDLPIHYVAAR